MGGRLATGQLSRVSDLSELYFAQQTICCRMFLERSIVDFYFSLVPFVTNEFGSATTNENV